MKDSTKPNITTAEAILVKKQSPGFHNITHTARITLARESIACDIIFFGFGCNAEKIHSKDDFKKLGM